MLKIRRKKMQVSTCEDLGGNFVCWKAKYVLKFNLSF